MILKRRKITKYDFALWRDNFVLDLDQKQFDEILLEMDSLSKQDKSYSFLVEDENKNLIGFIQAFNILRFPALSATVEIMIVEKFRKKGLGEKCILLLEEFCFKELGLLKMIAPILPDNKASIALFKKLNYEKICTDPYAYFFNNRPVAHEIFVKVSDLN